jgi:hypothetical protein
MDVNTMTLKNSRESGGIRSTQDWTMQRDSALEQCRDLMRDATATMDAIERVGRQEQEGLDDCGSVLSTLHDRVAILDSQIPDDESPDRAVTATPGVATEECPQCHTNAYCISRPIKMRDLSEGNGLSAAIVAGVKVIKLKWGSHSSARLISCMKCGQQFIPGEG